MALNKDDLVFNLDFFQQPANQKIIDTSGHGHDATLHGNVTSVSDPIFGRCLAFDGQMGSYLSLAPMTIDYSQGITVEAFVWYDSFNNWSRIIDFANGPGQQNILLANMWGTARLAFHSYDPMTQVATNEILQPSQWLHLVGTISHDGQSMLYQNAQMLLEQSVKGSVPSNSTRNQPFIGRSHWAGNGYFHGKMATLRVYNRALDPQEIWESYAGSRMATFRATHPVDFQLVNTKDEAVLYIAGPQNLADRELTLNIINSSGASLYWGNVNTSGTPNAHEHHLELRFRKGVLSADTLKNAAFNDNSAWKLGIPPAAQQSAKWDSLYLTHTGNDRHFAPGATIPLSLTHFHADGHGGSRGTQVELIVNKLHRNPNLQDAELRQTRVHHINVIDHQSDGGVSGSGRPQAPLHVAFVGSNTILNDGHPRVGEKLKLRFTNSSLTKTMSLTGENLKITLQVPAGPKTDEWALGTAAAVKAIQWKVLNADGTLHAQLADQAGGQSNTVTLEIDQTKIPSAASQLGHGQFFTIELDFSNFSTQHPTGISNIVVHYENIPDYAPGQLVVPIYKSPLLFRQQNAGLGVLPNETALHLNGDIQQSGNVFQQKQHLQIKDDYSSRWIRFAQSSSHVGATALGKFKIVWGSFQNLEGDGSMVVAANVSWNDSAQGQLAILESAGFRAQHLPKLRLVTRNDDHWADYFLEIYFEDHTATRESKEFLYDIHFTLLSGVGWKLITPENGEIPDGYHAYELSTGVMFATRSGAANSLFAVHRNGVVSVGATSPSAIKGASVLQIGSAKLSDGESNGQLVIGKNNGAGSHRKFRLGLDDNYHLSMGDFGNDSDHTYKPYLTIKWDSGNVGIGTQSPTSKLEVQGNTRVNGLLTATALQSSKINLNNNNNVYLQEDQPNHLKIHAKQGIQLSVQSGRLTVNSVVEANAFKATNEMAHRMYPSNPMIWQDVFEANWDRETRIQSYGKTDGQDSQRYGPSGGKLWEKRRIWRFGHSHEKDGTGALLNVPEGHQTIWIRVLGDRWSVFKAYLLNNPSIQYGKWVGGRRSANTYCPDGSLADSFDNKHIWLPIPVSNTGHVLLVPNGKGYTGDDGAWISGVAFSRNPWSHATQSAIAYHWAVNGGDRVNWEHDYWNNDLLGSIGRETNWLLKVPVIPSGRDKLLYLVEHNDDWNGCMHTGITVNGHSIERFCATYDNPFSRHWNSKNYERYVAARIPASLIHAHARFLDVRIDMSKQNRHIYFREIGTHDFDVPVTR